MKFVGNGLGYGTHRACGSHTILGSRRAGLNLTSGIAKGFEPDGRIYAAIWATTGYQEPPPTSKTSRVSRKPGPPLTKVDLIPTRAPKKYLSISCENRVNESISPRTTRTRKPPSAAASHPAFDFSGQLLIYQSNVREADGVNRPSKPQSVAFPGPVGLIPVPV